MTNREKYKEKILDIVFNGDTIAVDINTKEPVPCGGIDCRNCLLFFSPSSPCNDDRLKAWSEKEVN